MASPSNNRNRSARPTGGKAGGRAGKPSNPVAGTKDKTVRVPKEWNAKTVDPTNNRGSGQRPTGGQAGGRAGKPSGSIARPAAGTRPSATPKPSSTTKPPAGGRMQQLKDWVAGNTPKQQANPGSKAVQWLGGDLPKGTARAAAKGAAGLAGRALVLPALVSQIADVGKGFQELANSPFLNKGGTGTTGTRTGRTGRGGTTNDVGGNPARDGRYIPGSQQVEIKDRSGRQSVASRAEAPPAPKLPAPVTRSNASSGSGRAGSGSSSTPRRSGPTSTRKASTAPTPPTERRVSASTANRESGNYGTSKTNNPLMKDMIGRIKDREDKAQSSAASKLTSNFGKDSGYQPKDKVDGSKVDTKKKLSSTTNEYNSKKRRYGG